MPCPIKFLINFFLTSFINESSLEVETSSLILSKTKFL